ncbi:MAG: hypothetical protein J0L88_15360 [Xanthomonadales bacterium]|nr:hypothetical protein [Xanthomonadales bacterium]
MGKVDKRKRRQAAARERQRREPVANILDVPDAAPTARTPIETVGIIVRDVIPLGMVLAFGWSIGQYVLISVFDLTFAVTSIAMVGVSVSHRQVMNASGPLDALGSWLAVVGAGALVSLLLTAVFGWVVALMAWQEEGRLFDRTLVLSALAIVLAAAPSMYRRYRADAASGLPEAVRKRRDEPRIQVLMASMAMILFASFWAAQGGRIGLHALAVAVTALSLLRDLRPDLLRKLVPAPRAR